MNVTTPHNAPQFHNDKWFFHFQGRVKGPYSPTELQQELQQLEGANLEQALVWKRGLQDWIKASQWRPDVDYNLIFKPRVDPTVAASSVSRPTSPATPKRPETPPPAPKIEANLSDTTVAATRTLAVDTDKTYTHITSDPVYYQVQLNFVDQPAMTKNDLISFLSQLDDVSGVSVKDPKSHEWKEVYAYPDLVEKLGLSRRKHPRVPILAQFNGQSNKHPQLNARIITISEGGMGFTEVYDLKIGDLVEGQLTSPHFFQPINVKADVVFSGLDGYIGLNFTQINEESKATIIEYIKKFGKGSSQY